MSTLKSKEERFTDKERLTVVVEALDRYAYDHLRDPQGETEKRRREIIDSTVAEMREGIGRLTQAEKPAEESATESVVESAEDQVNDEHPSARATRPVAPVAPKPASRK